MMKSYVALLVLFLVQTSCTTPERKIASATASVSTSTPSELPSISTDAPYLDRKTRKIISLEDAVQKSVKALITPVLNARIEKKIADFKAANPNKKLKSAIRNELLKDDIAWANDVGLRTTSKIKKYMMFLGLNASDFAAAEKLPTQDTSADTPADGAAANTQPSAPEDAEAKDDGEEGPSNIRAIKRFFSGSTQFLFCDDLTDLECLEKEPELTPTQKFRQPLRADLGKPVYAGASLDMDVYFTQAWDGSSPVSGVANRLAEKLNQDVEKGLSIAMYGIDDIAGTMMPVYDAIYKHSRNPNISVRSVVDVSGLEKNTVSPGNQWIFSYTSEPEASGLWLFGKSEKNPLGMHATFQYDGTPNFIQDLNNGAKTEDESRVRIEWPRTNIMHNKYAVLEAADGRKSVWTGTANISNHCMGSERNANMSVYVRNTPIAQAYLDEFNLMFNFDSTVSSQNSLVVNKDRTKPFQVGRFHRNKYPVSQRLFTFDDGTRARVHFAPTDDAEHRVILPMLLSANEGDEIRISMFGGTGYEIIRALQFAAAKGANVKIVFDSMLSKGPTSWIRDPKLNLTMANPYLDKVQRKGPPGKVEVRVSTWAGKNHYKAGTLVRKKVDGRKIAEEIIVGSQNWSSGGNDSNDENMLSIQNLNKDVPAALLFNAEFDNHLWTMAR